MRRIRIMNKIQGYDEAQAYTGESRALPAGKYICEIKGAKEVEAKNGKKQLVLQLDIAEGEYKDFYSDQFSKTIKEKGTNAKWNNGGLFRQGYEGKQLPFFKGMITCIEESNEGYEWNWDEKTLKGKKIGVLFGREQYLMNGQKKWATKARAVRSIKGLEMSEIPQDKLLDGSTSGFDTSGFDDEDESEEDLPF